MSLLNPACRISSQLIAIGILAICGNLHANTHSLNETIQNLVDSGPILGAQVLVGENDRIILERNFGTRSASDSTVVNSSTQFCIGSCSKPFASATIMALSQQGILDLDAPISEVLPAFRSLKLVDFESEVKAPSLLQLLAHRGGIYSQKRGMNRRQARWIRDFKLTLADSVKGIANEELIFEPGSDYAYSGAGYCVIGQVAEVATGQSFENLFQQNIARPLGLARTTYFPDPEDPNIATGSVNSNSNPATPHLSDPFRLPLIGGSLYSTARETSRFIRMILERGRFGNKTILKPEFHQSYLSLPFDGKAYGLGWSVNEENDRPKEIAHTGSLASSRAAIRISLDTGRFAIVYYTLADPSVSAETGRSVNRAILVALN